ncbi:MAG: hydrolase Nlp/P60 [Flavobacteriaceae bacterium TMED42]|nr:MAG: hydrolase Nlp/P60 [Flavobacteriaceae bacterium TMED42]|tara:strand:- start:3007 stop:3720 length:714 start_codon:yes stop_codon:yes gene_type:complete
MRKENSHQSEMVSQLLYGECYKIVEKRKNWVKIRLEWDGYEGWIDQNQLNKISRESFDKITQSTFKISIDLVNYITTEENLLFPVLIGSDLRGLKTLRHRFEGEFERPKKLKKSLISTAYLFLNAPYLWGGKTLLGIDCSAFTQMVYKINGVKLSRDADQQSLQGQTLSFIEESEAGDLAFFDNAEGKITHVGLLLENHHIIHASGTVRIDRIDQSGIFNVETQSHSHKLRFIKKMM